MTSRSSRVTSPRALSKQALTVALVTCLALIPALLYAFADPAVGTQPDQTPRPGPSPSYADTRAQAF